GNAGNLAFLLARFEGGPGPGENLLHPRLLIVQNYQGGKILRGHAGILDELVAVADDAVAALPQTDAIGVFEIAPQAAARIGHADQRVAVLARIPHAFQRQAVRPRELIAERHRLAVSFAAL